MCNYFNLIERRAAAPFGSHLGGINVEARAVAVERFDLRAMALMDHEAPDLQRRRQVAAVVPQR